jgi:hypothetical protein
MKLKNRNITLACDIGEKKKQSLGHLVVIVLSFEFLAFQSLNSRAFDFKKTILKNCVVCTTMM